MALKYNNRDVIVLRPLAGGNSWSDDLVVVRVLESGEEEVVRKGAIIGYTEDPNSEAVKNGEALVGVAADSTHPATNAKEAQARLDEHNKRLEETQAEQQKTAEQNRMTEAKQAPVVQTVQFDPKTAQPSQAPLVAPAVTKTTKK